MHTQASTVEQREVQEIASVAAAFQRSKLVSQLVEWQAPVDASPTLTPQSSCADLEADPSDVSSITDLQSASELALPAWLQNPSRHGRVHPRNERARMKPAPSGLLGGAVAGQHLSRRAGLRAQGNTVLASVHGHVAPMEGKRHQRFKTQTGLEAKAVASTRSANGSTPKANAKGAKSAAPLQQRSGQQDGLRLTSARTSTGKATVALSTAPPRLAMSAVIPSAALSPTQLKADVAAYLATKQLLGLCTLNSAHSSASGTPQTSAAGLAFDLAMRMGVHTVGKNHIARPPPGLAPPPGL